MTPVIAILLSLLTVHTAPSGPIYVAHARHQPIGAELYVESVVHWAEDAALVHDVDRDLLLALVAGESAVNDRAVEPRTGAKGLLQLLPGSKWQRAVERDCKGATRSACAAAQLMHGAAALRYALDACDGDEWAAVGFHRSGRCIRGPRGRRVIELAWELRGDRS